VNFFEHQDRARSSTKLLVFLFVCAVVTLILITAFVIVFTLELSNDGNSGVAPAFNQAFLTSDVFLIVSTVVVVVVGLGTLFRLAQLRGGGKAVAESMGGRLLNVQTRDADERKVLNVVEEMAIAAGLPVPSVYLIDDAAINAFAAGYEPQDAVIGITRGCIRALNRDELQGVVAHEFSHILNGDMRLNIRLIGWLYGIMVIGLIGYHLLRSSRYSGSSRKKGGGIVFLGLGLMIVGYGGTFFGNLIKAAVSRQREFLADASAVQYTRNPGGIGGALKKIGGYAAGTRITTTDTSEISHMLFGPSALFSLFATHPPLAERIRRIEPRWNGEFGEYKVEASAVGYAPESPQAQGFVASVGQPTATSLHEAQQRLASLPAALHAEVHNSLGGTLTVFALIIAASEHEANKAQWQYLRTQLPQETLTQLLQLYDLVVPLERKLYLPLVDLALPALHQLSAPQWKTFMLQLQHLIRADAKVSLFEWCLFRILRAALSARANQKSGPQTELEQCDAESRLLLSALARAGHASEDEAQAAFAAGMAELPKTGSGAERLLPAMDNLTALDAAVDRLRNLKPLQKPRLLKAMVHCIRKDGEVTSTEAELLRAVGAILNCPVPPLA
jgi:Zn-dependent protease with chaperone function